MLSALTTALTKNIYASVLIENFKSQGVFCPEKSTRQVYIYEVPSEEERPCYTMMGDTILPGAAGDILLSLNSEMDIPFVKEFVSFLRADMRRLFWMTMRTAMFSPMNR